MAADEGAVPALDAFILVLSLVFSGLVFRLFVHVDLRYLFDLGVTARCHLHLNKHTRDL